MPQFAKQSCSIAQCLGALFFLLAFLGAGQQIAAQNEELFRPPTSLVDTPASSVPAALGSREAPLFADTTSAAPVSPTASPQIDQPPVVTQPNPAPTKTIESRPPRKQSTNSLALPRLGQTATSDSSDDKQDGASSGIGSTMISVLSSLAIVLGLFLLCAWLLRRAAPKGSGRLPDEVIEVLGQAQLAARQNVHLLRLGNKLLLVNVSPAGVETLTEIDDPLEVDRLAGLCKQSAPESSSSAFRNVFQQFSREPAPEGFLGNSNESNASLASLNQSERKSGERKLSSRRSARENTDV